MKKTLITLLALAGVVSAAERENLWQLTFGTGEGYTADGYKITNYGETQYAMSGNWDISGHTGNGYLVTDSTYRVHSQWHNTGTGLTFGEDFGVELVFSVPTGYSTYAHCTTCADNIGSLLLLSTSNNSANDIHFGPSVTDGTFLMGGTYVSANAGTSPLTFKPDTQYTAQLEVIGNAVTLKIDGNVVQTGTLTGQASGSITQVLIGGSFIQGGDHTNTNWISENVYSITAYKIIPEPATATLSLLALAGLAARRRRK